MSLGPRGGSLAAGGTITAQAAFTRSLPRLVNAMRSPASMRSAAALRALAASKGYAIEKAQMQECWRIVGAHGFAVTNPRAGGTSFTTAEAIAFLKPDV
jgi:hypothetical protein